MLMLVLSIITNAQFPVCTAPGDQLYPDVCWDGEAFWVVWADEELGTIQGVRINEAGEFLTEEIELLESGVDPGPVRYPCVATGLDRIAVEARVMVGQDIYENELWGVMHQEYSSVGAPLTSKPTRIEESFDLGGGISSPQVLFGRDHFFSLYRTSIFSGVDYHAYFFLVGFDDNGVFQQDVWMSSIGGFEFQPSIGCWDGHQFLIITAWWDSGVFLEDTLLIQGIGWDYELNREEVYKNSNDDSKTIKYQAIVAGGDRFFFASEVWSSLIIPRMYYKIGFDILDSTGIPIKDSATIIDLGDEIKLYYPDAAYGKESFVCCWENRFQDNTVHIYAIKVDTLGEILKSGYIIWEGSSNQQPALTYGAGKYFLTWSDNRNGDFNIRGMIFDTLEVFEGIAEPLEVCNDLPAITVDKQVFSGELLICFSSPLKNGTEIEIRDALGRTIKNIDVDAGKTVSQWDGCTFDGSTAEAGVYFVKIQGKSGQGVKVIKF